MLANWEQEERLTVQEAAAFLQVHQQRVYEWIHRGVRLRGGGRLYLEAVLIDQYQTSREACRRFVERRSPQQAQPERTAAESQRAGTRAGEALRAKAQQRRRTSAATG